MSAGDDLIRAQTLSLLAAAPNGMRWSELLRQLYPICDTYSPATVKTKLRRILSEGSNDIVQTARGKYVHAKFASPADPDIDLSMGKAPTILPGKELSGSTIREFEFYESFAEWLVNDLQECTKAIALGGNIFKDKWGTPDVIGVLEPRKSDIVRFATEVVTAEIKIDSSVALITGFGQACAYNLFSHRSYLVVPKSGSAADLDRLDALAGIFGIGLILFDAENPKDPNYQIRARAKKREPDMAYVNKCLALVEKLLFD